MVTPEQTSAMGTYKNLKKKDRKPAFMFEEENSVKRKMKVRDCDLPEEFSGLDRKVAFVIENAFSEAECAEMIEWTEKNLNYSPALLNIGYGRQILDTDARNHERAIYDSHEMVDYMFERVKEFLPKQWHGQRLSCLNERLRYLKYEKGGYFAPHWDGSYARKDGSEQSFLTYILYLNQDFEGGETNFLSTHDREEEEYPVGIKTGSLLIFQHDIYHEGSALTCGTKYCVRTDVMYKREKSLSD